MSVVLSEVQLVLGDVNTEPCSAYYIAGSYDVQRSLFVNSIRASGEVTFHGTYSWKYFRFFKEKNMKFL